MINDVLYQIKTIPDVTYVERTQMRSIVNNSFEKIIEYFSSITVREEGYIRLILLSGKGSMHVGDVRVYVHLYGIQEVFAEQIVEEIKQMNYGVERIGGEDKERLFLRMHQIEVADTKAVVKSEKAIDSPYSALGYYYFTSVMDWKEETTQDNFSNVLSTLEKCSDSFIAFDLIPTDIRIEEEVAVREMKTSLEQLMQGSNVGGQVIRDPVAGEVYPFYKHYFESIGEPVYRYNIIVSSATGASALLASQIVSFLRFSTSQKVDFEVLEVDGRCFESYDIGKQPFVLNATLMNEYRNPLIWNSNVTPVNLFRFPFLVSGREAVTFFRLPVGDGTISSIKVNTLQKQGEKIDDRVLRAENIIFGGLQENEDILIGASLSAFAKHGVIVGMPGSGKTTFSVNLLLQFYKKGIPFLAIEPTKTEYRAMMERIPEIQVFTPGNSSVAPFIINPFIPPKGVTVEQYVPSLFTAFQAAFSMFEPLDMLFYKAIRSSYLKYGWKDYSKYGDSDVTVFGLHEFIIIFKELLSRMNYGRELKGNLESAGVLRLTTLLEQNSNIYDTIHTISIEDLLLKPTVLELNAIDNDEQKALLMALLLVNVSLYTKQNNIPNGDLKNVILMDEAHVLLENSKVSEPSKGMKSQNVAVKFIQRMIREIRSFGTGMIIADQMPSSIGQEIIANTDIKIAFRTIQSIEKELIADSTNMSEGDIKHLSRLGVGEAYVYYSLLDYPKLIKTKDVRKEEKIRLSVPDLEVHERMIYWKTHNEDLKPFEECRLCKACKAGCDFYLRSNAEYIASVAFEEYRKAMTDDSRKKKCIYYLQELLKERLLPFNDDEMKIVVPCAQIRLYRKMHLEFSWSIGIGEFSKLIKNGLVEEV